MWWLIMKRFTDAIREINFTIDSIILFSTLLNAVLIFLTVYIVLLITGFQPWYAVIPSFSYLVVYLYRGITKSKAPLVEEHYKGLKDKLRTAVDNIQFENPVVDSLQSDVISQIGNVEVASFINPSKVSYKVIIAVVLCFAIIFLTVFDVQLFDINAVFDRVSNPFAIINRGGPSELEGNLMSASEGGLVDDIYGEKSVAKLGDQNLDIQLKTITQEINVRDIKDIEPRQFEEVFPNEIFVESAETCLECGYQDFGPAEQELIKNYFLKTTQ
jgi:hypothetical protein